MTGSYDVVWWIAIGLGLFAAARQPADPRAGAAAPGGGMSPRRRRLVAALGLGRRRDRPGAGLRRLSPARRRGRPGQSAVELLLGPRCAHEPSGGAASPWLLRWAHLIRPGGRVLDLAAGGGRHSRWLAANGFAVTAVDRDAAAMAALRRRRRDAGRRPRGRRPGRSPAAASTPCWSRTISGGRSFRRSSPRSAPAASFSTRPSPPATRPSAGPPGPTFCSPAVNFSAVAAGLQVVAYEDGFLGDPDRFVQRIAAVRALPAASPPRHPLAAPAHGADRDPGSLESTG